MDLPILIPFIIVIVLAALLVLIIRIPFRISMIFERSEERTVGKFSGSWCIFSVNVSFSEGRAVTQLLFAGKPVFQTPISPPSAAIRKEIPVPAADIQTILYLVRLIAAAGPGILRVLWALKRNMKFDCLHGEVMLGTGSPASTGLIFGLYSALRPLLMLSDRVSISVNPVFDREVLEGRCRIDLRIERPGIILALIFRLFLYRDVRKLLGEFRVKRERSLS